MLRTAEARELIDYDGWANERMARVLARASALAPKIRRAWAHLAATSDLWYARCAGDDYKRVVVWPETEVAEASQRVLAACRRWREMIESTSDADLERSVKFTNTRGEACADKLGDIVRHLVNHGTHHRAQIAMLLRDGGTEPADLDFIIYCRERGSRQR
jgi:uncharacterized damage-inducible protein DinB